MILRPNESAAFEAARPTALVHGEDRTAGAGKVRGTDVGQQDVEEKPEITAHGIVINTPGSVDTRATNQH